MRLLGTMITLLVLLWLPTCSSVKLRSPLVVGPNVPQAVSQLTQQGTRAYEKGHVEEAKVYFEQAVAGAPNSAEAHYNVGLALFALGETDQAREQFIEAANLAPGNKVIWDSPALRPFGSPEPSFTKQMKEQRRKEQRR